MVDIDDLLGATVVLDVEEEETDLVLPPGVTIGTLQGLGWDEENVFAE